METITGTAAGVPFTALPPTDVTDGPAPLIVTWHMLDAPRTDAAFAAALPMTGVPRRGVLRPVRAPGLEPAPQLPTTKLVDEILTQWFLRQLTAQ